MSTRLPLVLHVGLAAELLPQARVTPDAIRHAAEEAVGTALLHAVQEGFSHTLEDRCVFHLQNISCPPGTPSMPPGAATPPTLVISVTNGGIEDIGSTAPLPPLRILVADHDVESTTPHVRAYPTEHGSRRALIWDGTPATATMDAVHIAQAYDASPLERLPAEPAACR